MMFNNPKINNGLPNGMVIKQLVPGAIIGIKWNDNPKHSLGLIVKTEKRKSTYQGEFKITIFDGSNLVDIVNTQITGFVDPSYFVPMLKNVPVS